jgi:hypothetical protein
MYVDYGLTIPKHELNEADNKDIFVARRQAINGMAGLSMMLTGLVAGRISTWPASSRVLDSSLPACLAGASSWSGTLQQTAYDLTFIYSRPPERILLKTNKGIALGIAMACQMSMGVSVCASICPHPSQFGV